MKIIRRVLLGIHIFVGLGAMFGGMAAILNPQEPMGITVDALKNSPFSDYLIPGIILFVVIGVGNLFSAVIFATKTRFQGYISSVFSWALVFWIIIQCIMLWSIVFLHVLFFVIGLIQALLSAILMIEQKLFPTNIIINIYQKIMGR